MSKIYSGGLGVLAGDYVKEASDSNVDYVRRRFPLPLWLLQARPFLWTGQQIANYEAQDFDRMPIERVLDANGNQVVVDVPFPNFTVHALIWRVNVGRVPLYLLDTDNEMNSEYDRSITHSLYGGDWENRMKQEYLLVVGGIPRPAKARHQEGCLPLQRGTCRTCQPATSRRLCGKRSQVRRSPRIGPRQLALHRTHARPGRPRLLRRRPLRKIPWPVSRQTRHQLGRLHGTRPSEPRRQGRTLLHVHFPLQDLPRSQRRKLVAR